MGAPASAPPSPGASWTTAPPSRWPRSTPTGQPTSAATEGVTASVVDVHDRDAVVAWAAEVLDRHGGVDVLVNNVGHYLRAVPFRLSDPDHWDTLHEVNLRHVFLVTHAFLPAMLDAGARSIINVASVEGLQAATPSTRCTAAYKAAVAHFTTCLAGKRTQGHPGKALAPDLTQTPQVDLRGTTPPEAEGLWEAWAPVGRAGEPEDQADAAVFLASDLSRFVTGVNLPTDGGTHAYGGWFWSPSQRRFTNRPLGL